MCCTSSSHSLKHTHEIDRQKCLGCFKCAQACPSGALERCGSDMSLSQIVDTVKRDLAFYGNNGGITLSGGEPFMHGEATVELLKLCKEHGLSTAVETCGYANTDLLKRASEFVDMFLWDIKDTDEKRHRQFTGISNKLILENLKAVNSIGARIRLRCILVNGVNTDKEHYSALARIAKEINSFEGLEIIPYHTYGGTKSEFLGLADNGKVEWIPSEQQILEAKQLLSAQGINVI